MKNNIYLVAYIIAALAFSYITYDEFLKNGMQFWFYLYSII